MHKLTFAAVAAASALPCFGQIEFIGFSYNGLVVATSRGSVGVNAGEVMTRLEGREHTGWGRVNWPVMERRITNIAFNSQDQDAATPEAYDVILYPEDAANPGYPDLTAGVNFALGVAGPTGTGIVAAAMNLSVAGGVGVPIANENSDIFVSFRVPANAGWAATDGLSFHITAGYQPGATFLTWDAAGAAQGGPPNGALPALPAAFPSPASPGVSHGLYRIGAGNANYDRRRHHFMDVAHTGSSGVGLAITNQTNYTGSNNPPPAGFGPCPGTADFISGSNPDINSYNTGRVDDIAFDYFRTGLGTGLVFFLMEFDNSLVPEIALSIPVPGSTGTICMRNPSVTVVLAAVADEAFSVTTIPAALRPLLLGLPVRQQAASIIVTTAGTVGFDASPCDLIVF